MTEVARLLRANNGQLDFGILSTKIPGLRKKFLQNSLQFKVESVLSSILVSGNKINDRVCQLEAALYFSFG